MFTRIFLCDQDPNMCVCFMCVPESEYRPLLPYSESTSQILLSSLNPVDNRKWRRKSWGWRVLKALKVCVCVCVKSAVSGWIRLKSELFKNSIYHVNHPSRVSCTHQTPLEFVLLLCIPVVDPDKEDKNWRRPLNCLHLITGPLVCVLTFQSGQCKRRRLDKL